VRALLEREDRVARVDLSAMPEELARFRNPRELVRGM
jgi:hypothetical protein